MDRSIRILLVDDDSADRMLVKRALAKEFGDAVIKEADSRPSFMNVLDASRFDVIITDYQLGDIDGIEVIDQVRERELDTPIIMLTGTGTEEVAIEAMQHGVADYVIKNVQHVKRLPATVRHVLRTAELERERQNVEERLRQAQKMEAVGTLAAGVAHDIGNALTAIFGFAALARLRVPENHEALEALDGIVKAADHASRTTRSLITLGGRSVGARRPLDLRRVVTEAVAMLRPMLPAAIELVTDTDELEGLWIEGDATQLQQVIVNLAVNARDAMPNGGRLRLVCMRSPANVADGSKAVAMGGRAPAMRVAEDNGTGMSEEVRSRIFEPFFTTKERGQGTGLGMAMVHGIIEEHGGEIQVVSTEGEGTCVTIVLPRIDSPAADMTEPAADELIEGHDETIILVEDDRQVRAVIASMLEALRYNVVQVADGDAVDGALGLHKSSVRLVILDMDLPKASGLACLRRIRKGRPAIPVIVIGGLLDRHKDEIKDDAVLLPKPFPMSKLASLVNRSLADAPS